LRRSSTSCNEVHRHLLVGRLSTFWKPTSLSPHPRPLRYLFAIVITAAMLALRYAAGPWLGTAVPLMPLLAAPVLAAFYGGFGPGLLATVLAGLAGVMLFVPPYGVLLPPISRSGCDWRCSSASARWSAGRSPRAAWRCVQLQAEHERMTQVQAALAAARTAHSRPHRRRAARHAAARRQPHRVRQRAGRAAARLHARAVRSAHHRATDPGALPPGHAALRESFRQAPASRPMGAGRDLYALRRDGSEVPVEIALNHLPGEGSALVLTSITDISARKLAEHERAHLAGIVDASADAIVSQTLRAR
jgi:hypothetical protein